MKDNLKCKTNTACQLCVGLKKVGTMHNETESEFLVFYTAKLFLTSYFYFKELVPSTVFLYSLCSVKLHLYSSFHSGRKGLSFIKFFIIMYMLYSF